MHYVYILYSPGSDKYYVGQTEDIDQRLQYHNELSERSYTSKHRPWALVCKIEVPSRGVAMAMEGYIKGRKSRSYLKSLSAEEQARRRLLLRFGLKD